MAGMKLINSHCFTATNAVRSAVTITVLVLCLNVVPAEDLTTLDGKTYTNITDISKYTKRIFFTCNNNRIGIAITNLSDDVRTKLGIQIKTNAAVSSFQPQNALDVFFAQHADSKLEVEKRLDDFITVTNELYPGITENPSWSIEVTATGFELQLGKILWSYQGTNVSSGFLYSHMNFSFGQETLADRILTKFIDWKNIATTNHVESFKKELSSFPDSNIGILSHTFIFNWENGKAKLDYSDPASVASFTMLDVKHFQELLKFLPDLKEQLAKKIQNQETQKVLFK